MPRWPAPRATPGIADMFLPPVSQGLTFQKNLNPPPHPTEDLGVTTQVLPTTRTTQPSPCWALSLRPTWGRCRLHLLSQDPEQLLLWKGPRDIQVSGLPLEVPGGRSLSTQSSSGQVAKPP